MSDWNFLTLNGHPFPTAARTLTELLVHAEIDPEQSGIAVAANGALVRRGEWPDHRLHTGDVIEIVRAVQGG